MGKRLIIAEKPSVAADIARALGGFTRHGDHFESERYLICSAVGHLLELRAPEEHDPRSGRWTFKHLPVIPPKFELSPIDERAGSRLNLLLRLKGIGLLSCCFELHVALILSKTRRIRGYCFVGLDAGLLYNNTSSSSSASSIATL